MLANARHLTALAIILALYGCGQTSVPGAIEQEWLAWRKAQDKELATSPTSYLAAQDAHYMAEGTSVCLPDQAPGKMGFAACDPSRDELLRVAWDGKEARLTSAANDGFDLLEHGPWRLPNGLTLKAGEQKDGSLRVTLFDPEHPDLAAFDGLSFFDYAPHAVVKATFRKAAEVVRRPYTTTQDRESYAYIVGEVHFEYAGVPLRLEAYTFDYEDPPSYLALMFRDRTNGEETYAGGRYLTVELTDGLPPEAVELDFNRATNLYCARSPFWNCPVLWEPPLPVAIRAGELAPARPHH